MLHMFCSLQTCLYEALYPVDYLIFLVCVVVWLYHFQQNNIWGEFIRIGSAPLLWIYTGASKIFYVSLCRENLIFTKLWNYFGISAFGSASSLQLKTYFTYFNFKIIESYLFVTNNSISLQCLKNIFCYAKNMYRGICP